MHQCDILCEYEVINSDNFPLKSWQTGIMGIISTKAFPPQNAVGGWFLMYRAAGQSLEIKHRYEG